MEFYKRLIPYGSVFGALIGAAALVWFAYCWIGVWGILPALVVGPIVGGFLGAVFAPLTVVIGLAICAVAALKFLVWVRA